MTNTLAGPVNAVASQPATNAEFTAALGRALGRPTLAPVPAWAARAALGEMADELLLTSVQVMPAKLLQTGYEFHYANLPSALLHMLGPALAPVRCGWSRRVAATAHNHPSPTGKNCRSS